MNAAGGLLASKLTYTYSYLPRTYPQVPRLPRETGECVYEGDTDILCNARNVMSCPLRHNHVGCELLVGFCLHALLEYFCT